MLQSLRIMSKCDWRKLRNKYLNLQKRNMTVAKGKIRQMEAMHERNQQQGGPNNRKSPPQGGAQDAAGEGGEGGGPAASKELEFLPGVIVRYVSVRSYSRCFIRRNLTLINSWTFVLLLRNL